MFLALPKKKNISEIPGGQVHNLIKGIVIGFLISGCAGATFAWKHYGLKIASYDGKLLGVTEADDRDFKDCEHNNCVLMFTSDFYSFKQDYLDTKDKLETCEKRLL